MLLNCGVRESSWESLGCTKIQPVHPKGNQSWIFIGRTDAEAETPMLWPPDAKTDSLEKPLLLGTIDGRRRRGRERMRWLNGITNSMDMSLSKFKSWWWTGKLDMLQSMGLQRVRHDWATELTDWCPFPYPWPCTCYFLSTECSQFCMWVNSYFVFPFNQQFLEVCVTSRSRSAFLSTNFLTTVLFLS